MAHQVTFDSGGVCCVGRLYPATGDSGRAVILCAGFGGTQDTPALSATAQDFADAGYHAMTFDYRGFGHSDGRPRQVVDIEGQLGDIAAAVECARALPDIDPAAISLWGTSLGGGHVVVAASRDPGIQAVVAQVPFNGFPRRVEGRSSAATLRLLAVMGEDWVRARLRLRPHYIRAVGATGDLAVMTGQDAQSVIEGMSSPTWRNEVAPRALIAMMRYRPGDVAARVVCPLLVCVADDDREAPPENAVALAAAAPHGEVRRFPATHFDFYRDDTRRRVIAEQIDWLDAVTR